MLKFVQYLAIPEKNQTEGVEDILFWKLLWNFEIFNFTPGNSRPNKVSPLENPQIMLDPLEISRPETKTPGNSTLFFLGQPRKFHVFN